MINSLRSKAKERLALAASNDTLVLALKKSISSPATSDAVTKAHEPDEKPSMLPVTSGVGEHFETIQDAGSTADTTEVQSYLSRRYSATCLADTVLPVTEISSTIPKTPPKTPPCIAETGGRLSRSENPTLPISSRAVRRADSSSFTSSDPEGNYRPLQQWPRVQTPPDTCPTPRRVEPLAKVPTPPETSAIADDSFKPWDVSDTEMMERTPRKVPEPLAPVRTIPSAPSFLEKIRMAEATRSGTESGSSSHQPMPPPIAPPGERRYRNERVKCPPDDHLNALRNRAIEGLLVAVKSDSLGPSLGRVAENESAGPSGTLPPPSSTPCEVHAMSVEDLRRQARGALVQTSKSGGLGKALGVPGPGDFPTPSPPMPSSERGGFRRRAHGN
jgi:hypothetical protein